MAKLSPNSQLDDRRESVLGHRDVSKPDSYEQVPPLELLRAGVHLLRRHWALALGTVLSLMSVGLLETYPVLFVRRALESVVSDAPDATRSMALAIGGWYACVALAAGMGIVITYCSRNLGVRVVGELRQQIYDHV